MVLHPGAAAKAVAFLLLLAALAALSAGSAAGSTGSDDLLSSSQRLPYELEAVQASEAPAASGTPAVEEQPASDSAHSLNSQPPGQWNKFNLSSRDAAQEKAIGEKKLDYSSNSSGRAEVLIPLQDAYDYKIILDISPEPSEYIPGAVSLPYTDFLSESILKTPPQLAKTLGRAGIGQNDSVLIYGECQPCGGGPSAATYVYWIMKYLGHRNVSLLDGGIDDWVKAGKPTAAEAAHLLPANYTPTLQPDLLASYAFVHSGKAQIIDARGKAEFEAGSIPSSVNIPYDQVIEDKRIKDESALRHLFYSMNKDRPVVVYTNTGVKASMVWMALNLLGYDASIYSWKDWQASSASS